jgi:hypothetical protein
MSKRLKCPHIGLEQTTTNRKQKTAVSRLLGNLRQTMKTHCGAHSHVFLLLLSTVDEVVISHVLIHK